MTDHDDGDKDKKDILMKDISKQDISIKDISTRNMAASRIWGWYKLMIDHDDDIALIKDER